MTNEDRDRAKEITTYSTYDRDFYAWTQEQSTLLKNREWDKLDAENLIEEAARAGLNLAVKETNLPYEAFGSVNQFAPQQLLSPDFLPDGSANLPPKTPHA